MTEAPAALTDVYWRSRPLDARIAAIASDQSAPIAGRAELLAKVAAVTARGEGDPPRPDRWIGYRVWAELVELLGEPARAHPRPRGVDTRPHAVARRLHGRPLEGDTAPALTRARAPSRY